MDRCRLYKNKDKDAEALRRRRVDQSVELRKAKKDEQMQKRRNIVLKDIETSPLQERQVDVPEHVNYISIVEDMRSPDDNLRYQAVQLCRKTLSRAKNPPIDEFHRLGAVEILVELLSSKSESLLFEAAWALTNIASGDSPYTASVVNGGSVPKLVLLLDHANISVAEQSVWTLGNIAGDGAKFRDLLIHAGVIQPCVRLLQRAQANVSVVSNVAWLFSNLCRNRDPPPARETIVTLLPVMEDLLCYDASSDVVVDAAWALSYASDAANDFIDDIIHSGCVPKLLSLLSSSKPNVIAPALRAVGNLVVGNDEQTQAILDQGLLARMPALLNNEKSSIVKEACWLLSNITAGNVDQIQQAIDSNILPTVLELMHKGEFRIQKEACWVISNVINGGTAVHCGYLLNANVLSALSNLLTASDARVILMVIEGIGKLLQVSAQYGQLDLCCTTFESCGGLDKLEALQDHSNERVYSAAYDLIGKHFSEEEESEPTEESKAIGENGASASLHVNEEFQFAAPDQKPNETHDFEF